MADNYSVKDLELISEAVINGDLVMDSLPGTAKERLAQYWGSAGINIYSPDTDITMTQLAALQEQRSQEAFELPAFLKPIEWVGSKLYEAYSATVSPALSTIALGAHRAIYGKEEADQISTGFWGFEDMKDLWNDAHYVSPGQAIWMLGLNNEELRERGISPNQMVEDKKALEAGTYRDKPTMDDPFGIKPDYEEYFSKGAAKYVTGTTDFAVSWYADPLVLAARGAGAAKTALTVKPVDRQVAKGLKDAKKAGLGEEAAFDMFAQKPVFQAMVDNVMNIKNARGPEAALDLRKNFPTISKSANGDVLARLLTQAKDADEVSDILRISMGDHAGLLALGQRNALLEGQINLLNERIAPLATVYDRLTDAAKATPQGKQLGGYLAKQDAQINKMNRDYAIIDDKMSAFGSIDNMNFNRVTTPLGMKIRGSNAWQGGGQLKPTTGQGFIKGAGALMYNASVGFPIKVIRSYNDIRPTAFIDTKAEGSYKELEATLGASKALPLAERQAYAARYLRAQPTDRALTLQQIEQDAVNNIVGRYNAKNPNKAIEPSVARDLYEEIARQRGNAQAAANGRVYGTGKMPDPNNPGQELRTAEIEADGGRLLSTPLFDSQLAGSHVMLDFDLFEKTLSRQGERLGRLKNWTGNKLEYGKSVVDVVESTWKFAQLFRLGYAPRALADDFLGQVARFGALSMIGRVGEGTKNMTAQFVRGTFMKDSVAQAKASAAVENTRIGDLGNMQTMTKNDLIRAKAMGADPADIARLEDKLDDVTTELTEAQAKHAAAMKISTKETQMKDLRMGRQIFAGPYAGSQGALFKDLASGQGNFGNLMGSSADWYLKRVRRDDWSIVTPASRGEDFHLEAWQRTVTQQIANSPIGKQALLGKSEGELAQWAKSTPEGRAHLRNVKPSQMPVDEWVTRIKAEVDHVMNPALPGIAEARVAAAEGRLTADMLKTVPKGARPEINAQSWGYAEGTNQVAQLLDMAIQGWYKLANQIPATKLLRNPLFGQSYKAHLAQNMDVLKSQGVTHVDDQTRKILESNARKGALDDVKKYTFTMDQETKAAYMMRHFAAFFGAQQESWNRWARIISEKPQILGRVAGVYGAPARAGIVVDQSGNTVGADGYVNDPVTGERKLVKYGDRKLLIQIPDYLGGDAFKKAVGMDEDAVLTVPMSSLELVLNHGDGMLPVGAGPFVQIGTNHFAKEDPKIADWSQKLGILPFGPQDSFLDFINPNTGKRLGDSMDDMSETKQRALFNMMQVEHYKYEEGLRDTEPTWKELMDRADRWTAFRTMTAFGMPFSINQQDPYQFFRDEFSRMQKLDPEGAEEKFYDKYGDSFYMFSQSMSKNNTGLKPTAEGVQMSKYYKDLIDKVGPEYAGLIVGDEGDGKFSNGAYFYQKTHGAAVGSKDMQRTQMSAREAWGEANISKGWQVYNGLMDEINSKLFDSGFTSYDDEGAEELKDQRTAITKLLTQQKFDDGEDNPFYNEEWEAEFSSLDKGKYDRNARNLEKIVSDPEIWSKAVNEDGTVGVRSDIYTLKTYLQERRNMELALAIRKGEGGSDSITAQDNADLKSSWDMFVVKLMEADTKFSWVHSRWFSGDMGFNTDAMVASGVLEEEEPNFGIESEATGQTLTGSSLPAIGVEPVEEEEASIMSSLESGGMLGG